METRVCVRGGGRGGRGWGWGRTRPRTVISDEIRATVMSCLCRGLRQCQLSPWCPYTRVVQHQPAIHKCLPSTIQPFPQPNRRVFLCVAVKGLWPKLIYQGNSLTGNGIALWWHRCGVVSRLDPAHQRVFSPLPGKGQCCMWCGRSPLARPSTKMWCWGRMNLPLTFECTVMCFSFTVFFVLWAYCIFMQVLNIQAFNTVLLAVLTVYNIFTVLSCDYYTFLLQNAFTIYNKQFFYNYMPWMLCSQFFDVVSNECSVVFTYWLAVCMVWKHCLILSTD